MIKIIIFLFLEFAKSLCDENLLLNRGHLEYIDKKILKSKDLEKKLVEVLDEEVV